MLTDIVLLKRHAQSLCPLSVSVVKPALHAAVGASLLKQSLAVEVACASAGKEQRAKAVWRGQLLSENDLIVILAMHGDV